MDNNLKNIAAKSRNANMDILRIVSMLWSNPSLDHLNCCIFGLK